MLECKIPHKVVLFVPSKCPINVPPLGVSLVLPWECKDKPWQSAQGSTLHQEMKDCGQTLWVTVGSQIVSWNIKDQVLKQIETATAVTGFDNTQSVPWVHRFMYHLWPQIYGTSSSKAGQRQAASEAKWIRLWGHVSWHRPRNRSMSCSTLHKQETWRSLKLLATPVYRRQWYLQYSAICSVHDINDINDIGNHRPPSTQPDLQVCTSRAKVQQSRMLCTARLKSLIPDSSQWLPDPICWRWLIVVWWWNVGMLLVKLDFQFYGSFIHLISHLHTNTCNISVGLVKMTGKYFAFHLSLRVENREHNSNAQVSSLEALWNSPWDLGMLGCTIYPGRWSDLGKWYLFNPAPRSPRSPNCFLEHRQGLVQQTSWVSVIQRPLRR